MKPTKILLDVSSDLLDHQKVFKKVLHELITVTNDNKLSNNSFAPRCDISTVACFKEGNAPSETALNLVHNSVNEFNLSWKKQFSSPQLLDLIKINTENKKLVCEQQVYCHDRFSISLYEKLNVYGLNTLPDEVRVFLQKFIVNTQHMSGASLDALISACNQYPELTLVVFSVQITTIVGLPVFINCYGFYITDGNLKQVLLISKRHINDYNTGLRGAFNSTRIYARKEFEQLISRPFKRLAQTAVFDPRTYYKYFLAPTVLGTFAGIAYLISMPDEAPVRIFIEQNEWMEPINEVCFSLGRNLNSVLSNFFRGFTYDFAIKAEDVIRDRDLCNNLKDNIKDVIQDFKSLKK